MGLDVDQHCDNALAAGKLAMQTHSEEHHKAAKGAHELAYAAAKMANRPSLAQNHLQQAALHDRHTDLTTPEGKSSAAHRATAKARMPGAKAEDHDAAAQAHKEAAQAHRDGGNGKVAMHHESASFEHNDAARMLRNPPPSRPQDMPARAP
jgi:hypothetical protein